MGSSGTPARLASVPSRSRVGLSILPAWGTLGQGFPEERWRPKPLGAPEATEIAAGSGEEPGAGGSGSPCMCTGRRPSRGDGRTKLSFHL